MEGTWCESRRSLSASQTHPTASTTIVTAVLDGGLAGFNSHRQHTAPRMRWPGQNPTPGHTWKAQVTTIKLLVRVQCYWLRVPASGTVALSIHLPV